MAGDASIRPGINMPYRVASIGFALKRDASWETCLIRLALNIRWCWVVRRS
jgi:hypothetical protein